MRNGNIFGPQTPYFLGGIFENGSRSRIHIEIFAFMGVRVTCIMRIFANLEHSLERQRLLP